DVRCRTPEQRTRTPPLALVDMDSAGDDCRLAGPGFVGVGRMNDRALTDHGFQPNLPRVALRNGVDREQAETTAITQEVPPPQEENSDEFGRTWTRLGDVCDEPIAEGRTRAAGDALPAEKRWIAYDSIESTAAIGEHLRK